MTFRSENPIDVLVIGAGVAGLATALLLAPRQTTVITARPLGDGGSTPWAQGGMAAAIGADDSTNLHFSDTVQAGAGLVDTEAASVLVDGGAQAVADLAAFGVAFDKDENGDYRLGREAVHCRNRILHATGDKAGAAVMAALIAKARAAEHLTIRERIIVEDLLRDDNGCIVGALAYDPSRQERFHIPAGETILATGGLGGLYSVTTNPKPAQGHGLAFAARAGALIRDPEFVQFHPTALDLGFDPAPLATEALRGDGARLVDQDGRAFMTDYHPAGDLAPRDIVARAVEQEIHAGRGAFLDATKAIGENFPEAFPTVYASCMNAGLDPILNPMPVAPGAHYHMGGVWVDLDGSASLEGLSAVGEVASSGVHGANRLASNSLLEAVVFSRLIAERLKNAEIAGPSAGYAPEDRADLIPKPAAKDPMAELRAAMAQGCGLNRDEDGLIETLETIAELHQHEDMTSGLRSALISAELIAQGALMREESRGAHYRTDFPETDDEPFHTEIGADL